MVGLGMVRSMEIFPLNCDATLNFEPLTLNFKPQTLNRMDACDASLQDINGLGDVSAIKIFHAERIILAEGWVIVWGIVPSKVIIVRNGITEFLNFKFLNR